MIRSILKYSLSDRPLGKSWGDWICLWWNWCYYGDAESSPVLDPTGELCGNWQSHPMVWFLAGTFGGYAERKCFIPADKSLFFPVLNDLISFATDPKLLTEEELSSYAKADLNETRTLQLRIDGKEIDDIKYYRVRTSAFDVRLQQSQIGEKNSNTNLTTRAVSDGYWMFLKPLSRGDHTIYFLGEKMDFDKISFSNYNREKAPVFRVEVMYHLTIY